MNQEEWDGTRNLDDVWGLRDEVLEEKVDGLFHTGQSYEDSPAETVYCKRCGGNSFHVGRGNYWTGIKCVKCLWEVCIHSG